MYHILQIRNIKFIFYLIFFSSTENSIQPPPPAPTANHPYSPSPSLCSTYWEKKLSNTFFFPSCHWHVLTVYLSGYEEVCHICYLPLQVSSAENDSLEMTCFLSDDLTLSALDSFQIHRKQKCLRQSSGQQNQGTFSLSTGQRVARDFHSGQIKRDFLLL